jgi:predicted enzyme related to lactoylglutathione lyase
MINAVHTVIHARDSQATRAFFRDVLNLPFADAGQGWLIFALPPGELGIHPTNSETEEGRHQLYLMCDDIQTTVEDLKAKGVEFTRGIDDVGWGLLTAMRIPGAGELSLYQPRHASPLKENQQDRISQGVKSGQ